MAQTNIGGILLGDIILGKSQSNSIEQSVTSTLSLTQTISNKYEVVSQSLSLSQTVAYNIVKAESVISTLALTQRVLNPFERTVTSTLTLTQGISSVKIQSVSQSLSLTQTIVGKHVVNALIVQSLNWAHTRGFNGTFLRSVSNTLTQTQTVNGAFVRPVSNTLTLSQTIAYVKAKHVTHALEFNQTISYTCNFVRTINSLLQPFQTIARTIKINNLVTSTLNLTQSYNVNRVLGVEQTLNLTQTVVGIATKLASNTLALTQSISYNQIHNESVEQTLYLTQDPELTRTISAGVHHGFGMNSFVKGHRQYNLTVTQTLPLTQQIRFNVYNRTVAQTLNLSQIVSYTPTYVKPVSSSLALTQTIGVNVVVARTVTSNLVFLPTRSIYVGMGGVEYITIDNVQYALVPAYLKGKKNRPHCVLQTNTAAITLPAPNWGDTENYGGIFTIRRSMNNIPYTHVKTISLRKLHFPWSLAKRKAWELREFLLQNNSKLMTLTTWKGDKWFVNLVTNPFELVNRSRYENENELVDIELEFEGLKVM